MEFESGRVVMDAEPTTGIVTPDQAQRLAAVHLAIQTGADEAESASQLAKRIAAVLGAKIVVLTRPHRRWTVLAQSGSHPPEFPPIDGAGRYLSRLQRPEHWTADGANWTLVPSRMRGATPAILAIQGDWTPSTSTLLFVAHNIALAQIALRTASTTRTHLATHRLSRVLSRTTGVRTVAQVVIDHMARAVDARIGALAVPDATNRTLSIVATHGYPSALVEALRIDANTGALGTVFRTGQPLHVRSASLFRHQRRHRYRTDSFVAVPIAAGRDVLGVACVTDRRRDEAFTHEHVSVLRALAAPAGLALSRERALMQSEAHAHAAAIDPVSGVFHRRYFHVRLEEELHRSRRHEMPLALLMVDIDDFKNINDSYGHLAGDAVLRDVAEILKHSIRVFDVCARFGGEEFAIIMPGSSAENAGTIAERIRQRIETYRSSDRALAAIRVTVSVGLAVSSAVMTSRELIARADQALYEAKRAGKNCVRALGPEDMVRFSMEDRPPRLAD
jgi:diguanylate cyclase (GGDEF)-like protein